MLSMQVGNHGSAEIRTAAEITCCNEYPPPASNELKGAKQP
jgi:hypothetical protein